MLKNFLCVLAVILPNSIKLFIYKNIFGWSIGKNVKIGFSLIKSQNVKIYDNVKIGNFNIIKKSKYLEVGMNSKIGNLNHISGDELIIGSYCGVTNGHVFDAGGGIKIGNNVTIAGMYSQIWSHEVSLELAKVIKKPVEIGNNVYIGSNSLIAPGAKIPSNVTVGLGAVVPSKFKYEQCTEGCLIVGNPACIKEKNIKITRKLNA